MPGFDGTGPAGLGPMSGRGRGFCALKLPASPTENAAGYAGRSGWPVVIQARELSVELAALRLQAQRVEEALDAFRRRIRLLEGAGNGVS